MRGLLCCFCWPCYDCNKNKKGQTLQQHKRSILIIGLLAAALLSWASPLSMANAQSGATRPAGFAEYLQTVRARAEKEGVSKQTLDRHIPALVYLPRVVALDRQQPEGSPTAPIPMFEPYRRKHVDYARISKGRSKYSELRPMLQRIETQTGVPEQVMLAIYGHETNYGSVTGNYHAPDALATLAFEGRRRPLFEGELIAVLKMIDKGVPSYAITGSWAGALGKPQFLPSVYLKLARDGDGDNYADIWNSEVDAMTSIANYLLNAGWRRDEPWGFAVSTPVSLNRAALRSTIVPPRCPRVFARHSKWLRLSEWRALGITPRSGAWPKGDMMATLIEPDGEGKTAYLLGSNYRAVLDYNCSNFYALSVGLLADEIYR
jgi:membrane-bound lytic murein transglycosylase B